MKGWKLAAAIVGGVALGVVLLCGGIVGAVLYIAKQAADGPQNVEIALACPEEVVVGREFEIVVTVKNTGPSAQSIAGIDIYDGFNESVDLTGSDPPWRRTDSMFDIDSYYYKVALPPGQPVSIRLKARAGEAGSHSGTVDVCINNDFTCQSLNIGVLAVSEHRAGSESRPDPGPESMQPEDEPSTSERGRKPLPGGGEP